MAPTVPWLLRMLPTATPSDPVPVPRETRMAPNLSPPSFTDAFASKIVKEEVEAEVIEVIGANVSVGVAGGTGGTKGLDRSSECIKQFPGVNF